MTRYLVALLALTAIACSKASGTLSPVEGPSNVFVDGPLRITTTDQPTSPGVLFVRPSSTGGTGSVTATGIRYGSVCALAVSGHADIAPGSVTIHIVYAGRLTACTADIRALTYQAVVSGLTPGAYDVKIMHTMEWDGGEVQVGDNQVTVR